MEKNETKGLEKKHDLLKVKCERTFFSSLIFKPLKKIMRKLNSQSQNFIRPSTMFICSKQKFHIKILL
jgi:hypothetical protein